MADAGYRIAPIFLIRMAGAPFEALEKLATLDTSRASRELIAAEADFSQTKAHVEEILASRRHDLSREQFRAWRKAVRGGVMPPAADPPSAAFVACWQSATRFGTAEASLQQILGQELDSARKTLMETARQFLPAYLVFAAGGVRDLLAGRPKIPSLQERKTCARANAICCCISSASAQKTTPSASSDHKAGEQSTPKPPS